ncbi:MAG: protein mobD [Polyangia bacterium]
MSMAKPVILIGGGKGGVGKSLLSMATLDYLLSTSEQTFLVETDTSVPDVYKQYKDELGSELVNLDEREGWIELSNILESKAESVVVINTGARNQTGVTNFGKTLSGALVELKRKLVVLWLIDRKRESMELLLDFREAFPDAELHVVRNNYLGAEKKFEIYNGSKVRTDIEKSGGRSLNFSELADRVTDAMNRQRFTIAKAAAELSLGDRMELQRWRAECKEMLAGVLGD